MWFEKKKRKRNRTVKIPCFSPLMKYANKHPIITVTIGAIADTQNSFGFLFLCVTNKKQNKPILPLEEREMTAIKI